MLYMNIAPSGRRTLSNEKLDRAACAVTVAQLSSAPATAWSDHLDAGRALATSLHPGLAPTEDRADLLLILGRANRGEPLHTLAARRVPGLPCTVEAKALRRTDGLLAIAVIATVEDGRRMAIGDLPADHPDAMAQTVAGVCGTLTIEARNGYMREGIPIATAAEESVARLAADTSTAW